MEVETPTEWKFILARQGHGRQQKVIYLNEDNHLGENFAKSS